MNSVLVKSHNLVLSSTVVVIFVPLNQPLKFWKVQTEFLLVQVVNWKMLQPAFYSGKCLCNKVGGYHF